MQIENMIQNHRKLLKILKMSHKNLAPNIIIKPSNDIICLENFKAGNQNPCNFLVTDKAHNL